MARADPRRLPVPPVANGRDEVAVYAGRARQLGLSFVERVDLGDGGEANLAAIDRASFAIAADGDRLAYLAPDEAEVPVILHWLARYPKARARLVVSTPSALRAALVRSGADGLARDAVEHLARVHPAFSARRVITRGQLAAGLALAVAAIAAFSFSPLVTLGVFDLVGAIFFFGVSALRFIAAAAPPNLDHDAPPVSNDDLPVYSVLVPLRDEAAMVPDLVACLDRLDWPGIMAQTPEMASAIGFSGLSWE